MDELVGPDGLGRVLRRFEPGEVEPPDPGLRAAEERLEAVRRALAHADLRLACAPAGDGAERLVSLELRAESPLPPLPSVEARAWPVTLGEGHARDAAGLLRGGEVPLGALALRDVSRFLGFRLVDPGTGTAALFTLGTALDGLPEERDAEILRAFIHSRDAFLR